MINQEVINCLGKKAQDKITGATGIIASVSFDLYGCIQALINPCKVDKDGKEVFSMGWIDINRVKILGDKTIMENPHYLQTNSDTIKYVRGCANKPMKV